MVFQKVGLSVGYGLIEFLAHIVHIAANGQLDVVFLPVDGGMDIDALLLVQEAVPCSIVCSTRWAVNCVSSLQPVWWYVEGVGHRLPSTVWTSISRCRICLLSVLSIGTWHTVRLQDRRHKTRKACRRCERLPETWLGWFASLMSARVGIRNWRALWEQTLSDSQGLIVTHLQVIWIFFTEYVASSRGAWEIFNRAWVFGNTPWVFWNTRRVFAILGPFWDSSVYRGFRVVGC